MFIIDVVVLMFIWFGEIIHLDDELFVFTCKNNRDIGNAWRTMFHVI